MLCKTPVCLEINIFFFSSEIIFKVSSYTIVYRLKTILFAQKYEQIKHKISIVSQVDQNRKTKYAFVTALLITTAKVRK